ncbi:MAG TPA: SAM-dependent methyltransferase [Candidatus Synoicihabitans sp.]|nr:SAM-dependent methyltransferase [Candidatus Synoicihabitans sp.]
MICRGQPGFEALLSEELTQHGFATRESGSGWVRVQDIEGGQRPEALCFAHVCQIGPVEVTGASVNQLAGAIADFFLQSIRHERLEVEWPCLFDAAAGLDGLGRRVAGVEEAFLEVLKKRLGRVARLARAEVPGRGSARGLFVWFVDFGRAFVSRQAVFGGQRRMADDPLAPSRSYLKVEEAFHLLGREPVAGEVVVDLGAAPGGWSYSAAKRGARVFAVDNGPLKGGALGHPLIAHRREDAFGFRPPDGAPVDWLFCDLVEDPHHVARNLVAPWLAQRWCRQFVVILKFGRTKPLALLREVTSPDSAFVRATTTLHVRHLYHDREEFTLVGEVAPWPE